MLSSSHHCTFWLLRVADSYMHCLPEYSLFDLPTSDGIMAFTTNHTTRSHWKQLQSPNRMLQDLVTELHPSIVNRDAWRLSHQHLTTVKVTSSTKSSMCTEEVFRLKGIQSQNQLLSQTMTRHSTLVLKPYADSIYKGYCQIGDATLGRG